MDFLYLFVGLALGGLIAGLYFRVRNQQKETLWESEIQRNSELTDRIKEHESQLSRERQNSIELNPIKKRLTNKV